jgi:hypothetical protein
MHPLRLQHVAVGAEAATMSMHCRYCGVPLSTNPKAVGDIYLSAKWFNGDTYCPDHYPQYQPPNEEEEDDEH